MFVTEDQAMSMARRYPKHVAAVELGPGLGFGFGRTVLDIKGHYSVWGEPADLLGQVSSVSTQDAP